jgi:hypothetical protein
LAGVLLGAVGRLVAGELLALRLERGLRIGAVGGHQHVVGELVEGRAALVAPFLIGLLEHGAVDLQVVVVVLLDGGVVVVLHLVELLEEAGVVVGRADDALRLRGAAPTKRRETEKSESELVHDGAPS